MIKVEFDNISNKYRIDEVNKVVQDETGGVYFLYNSENELIYVGRSICIKNRLNEHLKGATHTSKFYKEITYLRFLYTNSKVEQKIYELYAINYFRPKYNSLDLYDFDDSKIKIKSPDDIEKEKLVAFVIKFLKLNKGVPIDLYTVRQICENNNFKHVNLLDKDIQMILKENRVNFLNRKFIYR